MKKLELRQMENVEGGAFDAGNCALNIAGGAQAIFSLAFGLSVTGVGAGFGLVLAGVGAALVVANIAYNGDPCQK